MPLRLVMMGTGTFALPTFLGLYETDHEVVGLYTQPDRTGRGHHHHRNLLKEAALERGTPVFQPESVNTPDAIEDLRDLSPDLCVVAAYGQILSAEILAIPRLGSINVHASLLPKYRGAAPIQYAIWNGEKETGVTIFQIEPKLDAGLMLGKVRTEVGEKETSGQLHDRLAELAVPVALTVIEEIASDTARGEKQDSALVTKAPRLKKSEGEINWHQSAKAIECHIRAMQPWPQAFTHLHIEGNKPTRLTIIDAEPIVDHHAFSPNVSSPGAVLHVDKSSLIARTGEGGLSLNRVKPDGKREMVISDFLCGHSVSAESWFGNRN